MKISNKTMQILMDELQAAYDEQEYNNHYEINDAKDPWEPVKALIHDELIKYYSQGYMDGAAWANESWIENPHYAAPHNQMSQRPVYSLRTLRKQIESLKNNPNCVSRAEFRKMLESLRTA